MEMNNTNIENEDVENIHFTQLRCKRSISFDALKRKQVNATEGKRPTILEKLPESCLFQVGLQCNFSEDIKEIVTIPEFGRCINLILMVNILNVVMV